MGIPREIPTRLVNYSIAFALALIGFILFFWLPSIDAIIFIAFAIASIALVYSTDVLPKSEDLLEIPQVHYYYKQRMNPYGYAMAAMLVVISVLYSILSVFLSVRPALSALVLWAVAIIISYLISRYFAPQVEDNTIFDYLIRKLPSSFEDPMKVKSLIGYLNDNKVTAENIKFHEKGINDVCNQMNLNTSEKEIVISEYLKYKTSTTSKLNSSEIRAINNR